MLVGVGDESLVRKFHRCVGSAERSLSGEPEDGTEMKAGSDVEWEMFAETLITEWVRGQRLEMGWKEIFVLRTEVCDCKQGHVFHQVGGSQEEQK